MNEQVPVSRLQDWIKKSLSSELAQAEREREKITSELSRALESISQMCNQLSQKAERDMEKRENRAEYRAAKAVVRLTEVISGMRQSIVFPSSKDTVSLRNLQRQASKIGSDAAAARQEWLRQIRPYYIIDMMTLGGQIDKVRRLGEELHTFLVGRGSLLRSLEELNAKLSSLSKLELSKESTSTQRQSLELRLQEVEQEEQKLRSDAQKIRENPRMKEYFAVDQELRTLRGELVRTGFSRLGRPLRKLISVSERGDYPLPIDVREKAKEYANKPFTTFLKEDDAYPHLKAVLTALSNAVSTGKIALKQREAKKVLERTQQAVEGGFLMDLQTKSKSLKHTYDQLLADPEATALVQQLRELRKKGRANHTVRVELQNELQRTVDLETKLAEQIALQLKNIEAFVKELAGTSPKLELA
jgi:ribosomal protein S8